MTITEFLLARIAEDEAYARDIPGRSAFVPMPADADAEIATAYPGSYDRMLAECQAKRNIVEAHPLTTKVVPVWSGRTPGYACDNCARLGPGADAVVEDIGACDTLCALASVYAAHPDFSEEWKT